MAQARRDRLCLLERQLERAQPRAPLDAEQIRHRRAPDQPPHEHGMDLVLRARAGAHQLRAPRQPPAQHARPLIRRPHGVELAGRQQPRQRPRVEPVGLRPRLANTGIGGTDHDDAGDVRLEDPRDLPRAPGHLQRHPIASAPDSDANSSSRSGVVAIRPAERSAPPSTIATSQKSRCTSNPIALPTDPTSPSSSDEWRTSGRTTTTDACSRHIRASRRGGHRNSPSSKLIVQNGLPNHVLRESPCPGRPTVRPGPDSNPQLRSFMPRIGAAAGSHGERDARCSFDKRASPPAGSSRPLGTSSRRERNAPARACDARIVLEAVVGSNGQRERLRCSR